ncbi:hypothetical protein C8Q70DRAFT_1055108 [Cubamyces menziesii]|uniref:Fungal-type protein kinase domain-containing protein n=1 Tax=Trametes cubensis TaxID=1111947 RepID=A0AAD7TRF6_9APHY|nr:hypothetical protein C8Q70DRAFT_1055108 [Cubamyces menziesii]KAJ8473115.1 hypothetical protein ONZ51_g8070 [Trametes cubensis]
MTSTSASTTPGNRQAASAAATVLGSNINPAKSTPVKGTSGNRSRHASPDKGHAAYLRQRDEIERETMTIAGIKLDEWFTDALFHNGSAPDMPDDIKPVRVELEKTEVEMYPGLCALIGKMLEKAGCEDLAVYSCDNHPQLKGVDAKQNWYRPDIALYPTTPEAVKAYEFASATAAAKKHSKDSQASDMTSARPPIATSDTTSEVAASASNVPLTSKAASNRPQDPVGGPLPQPAEPEAIQATHVSELEDLPRLKARVAWSWMELLVEVKKGSGAFSLMNAGEPVLRGYKSRLYRGQLIQYAREVFSHQHRQFLFGINIQRDKARFLRADRNGILATEQFDYVEDPSPLWRFIYLFTRMSASQRGHDTTATLASEEESQLFRELWKTQPEVERNPALQELLKNAAAPGWPVYALCIKSKWSTPGTFLDADNPNIIPSTHRLLVGKPAYKSDSLVGRGGKAFVAYDLEEKVAVWVKDYWRKMKDGPSEFEIYQILFRKKATGMNSLTVRAGGDVERPPDEAEYRGGNSESEHSPADAPSPSWQNTVMAWADKGVVERHHCRLVFKEVCRTLLQFRTWKEVVRTFVGALKAHYLAFTNAEILHRDISVANILIYDPPDGSKSVGVLADWDLAKETRHLGVASQSSRSGTWQFLSIAKQCWKPPTEKIDSLADDLESFCHVLSWCVLKFCNHSRSDDPYLASTFYDYFDKSDPSMLQWDGNAKFFKLSKGKALVTGMGGRYDSPLSKLVDNLARLCKEHYNSPGIWEQWEAALPSHGKEYTDAEPAYTDEFGDLSQFEPDPPRTQGPDPEPGFESPFKTHRQVIVKFRDAASARDDLWWGIEKVPDQVPHLPLFPSTLSGTKRDSSNASLPGGSSHASTSRKRPKLQGSDSTKASSHASLEPDSQASSRAPSPSQNPGSRSGTPLLAASLAGMRIETSSESSSSRDPFLDDGSGSGLAEDRGKGKATGKGKGKGKGKGRGRGKGGLDRVAALRKQGE